MSNKSDLRVCKDFILELSPSELSVLYKDLEEEEYNDDLWIAMVSRNPLNEIKVMPEALLVELCAYHLALESLIYRDSLVSGASDHGVMGDEDLRSAEEDIYNFLTAKGIDLGELYGSLKAQEETTASYYQFLTHALSSFDAGVVDGHCS